MLATVIKCDRYGIWQSSRNSVLISCATCDLSVALLYSYLHQLEIRLRLATSLCVRYVHTRAPRGLAVCRCRSMALSVVNI